MASHIEVKHDFQNNLFEEQLGIVQGKLISNYKTSGNAREPN